MKILFCVILMILSLKIVHSQHMQGIVLSSEDSMGIKGSHILNITKNKIVISSELGYFSIPGDLGDTLVISNVNYITKKFIVNTRNHISIFLIPNLIQLEEVIVSNLPPSQADFRQKLIEMPMQDNGKFIPFGVKAGKPMSEIPPVYNRDVGDLKYTFSGKKIKEKVKYYKIKADFDDSIIRNQKYNREIVAQITGLEGDELTDFIGYLNFEISFLNKASEFEITENIKEKFEEYQMLPEVEQR